MDGIHDLGGRGNFGPVDVSHEYEDFMPNGRRVLVCTQHGATARLESGLVFAIAGN